MSTPSSRWECEQCHLPFRSQGGLAEHRRQVHKVVNRLKCPGCPGIFGTMTELMYHYERRECNNITMEQIHARRDEKLKFHNALLQRQEGFDPRIELAAADDARSTNAGTQPLTLQNLNLHGASKVRASGISHPNMVPFARGFGINLASAGTENNPTAATLQGNSEDFDPYSPNFDPEQYWAAGTYKCPHQRCQKYFEQPGALTAHLRGPAHNGDRFACPGCSRWFGGAAALAAHLETATRVCMINTTQEYGNVVDMLTAGLVEVKADYKDGRPRYHIAKDARGFFMAKAIETEREMKTRKEEEKFAKLARDKETFWEQHQEKIEW